MSNRGSKSRFFESFGSNQLHSFLSWRQLSASIQFVSGRTQDATTDRPDKAKNWLEAKSKGFGTARANQARSRSGAEPHMLGLS